jgi:hypothetical protein
MPNFSLPVFHVDSAIFSALVVVLESMFFGETMCDIADYGWPGRHCTGMNAFRCFFQTEWDFD